MSRCSKNTPVFSIRITRRVFTFGTPVDPNVSSRVYYYDIFYSGRRRNENLPFSCKTIAAGRFFSVFVKYFVWSVKKKIVNT